MKIQTIKFRRLLPAAMIILLSGNDAAQAGQESDLSLIYGDEDIVSIATGTAQPISRAPAVASVITAEHIKQIGATELDQVLETIPGLHVAVSARGYSPIYTIRGVYSDTNPQVLMLINGIPITNVFAGDRSQVWAGMPVNDIARIEVIRGPGSAVYGADAYAGVINIITKDANDIKGTEIGARGGSFNNKEAWLLHGNNYGGIDLAFSLEYGSTDGQHETIDADAQTRFDGLLGTSASLAPGSVNLGRKYLDSRFDASWNDWRLRLGYQGRWDAETGAGVAQALDPAGSNKSNRFNADLTYDLKSIEHWETTLQLSYFDTSAESDLVLYPPGAGFPSSPAIFPLNVFPNGVIGNPYVYERHSRFNVSTFYSGLRDHRIRLGAGVNYSDLYKIKNTKNFSILPGGVPFPLGSVVDVTDTAPFIKPHDRTDSYLFAQDEWSFTRDWSLTAGLRYDDYSDFGNTVNPRAALVWATTYNLTSKILYGRAFRAPSFAELYNINNPVLLGNPNLKPETIDTIEVAFDYQPIDKVRVGLNLFHYKMRDIIRFITDPSSATATAQNTGDQNGHGFEWEVNWKLSDALKLTANYAYQKSEDETTGEDAGNAPHHEVFANLDWRIERVWYVDPQITWISKRERVSGDPRPDLGGYTLVDLTLRRTSIANKFEIAASVRNLFDQDAREPSLSPGLISNDLPLPGRNFYVELRYTL